MKLFSVAKYKNVVDMYQKRNRFKEIVVKTLIVVTLFSVAKYKHVVETNQKWNKVLKKV